MIVRGGRKGSVEMIFASVQDIQGIKVGLTLVRIHLL